jgi:histidinol phosphatase-like PHP family hydrolase
MIITSDWHIHSEASYDAKLPLSEITKNAKEYGFHTVGITDHANFNTLSFINDIKNSARIVNDFKAENIRVVLGVELTPIEKPEFEYNKIHGYREGYVPPETDKPYDIMLAMTKDELKALGVRYGIGASHWRIDKPYGWKDNKDVEGSVREWHRQQMFLASDDRVTVLGHPWYNGSSLWYQDFSIIPRSMNMELADALKKNGKYVECNAHFFNTPSTSEKFRNQYAEFFRELFEMGIPVTYGSDSHNEYLPIHLNTEKYLSSAGFKEGDIGGLPDDILW